MRSRLPALYLLVQGVAVLGWWALLALSPRARSVFDPWPDPEVLDSYLLPDVVLLAGGSLAAGAGVLLGRRWAPAVVAGVAGAFAYATLHLVFWTTRTGLGWAGLVLVTPAVAGTLRVLQELWRRERAQDLP